LLLWTYLLKRGKKLMSKQEELGVNDNRYMYGRITLIPCTYLITILLGYFVSIQVAHRSSSDIVSKGVRLDEGEDGRHKFINVVYLSY
jgi:hypothetical protein